MDINYIGSNTILESYKIYGTTENVMLFYMLIPQDQNWVCI